MGGDLSVSSKEEVDSSEISCMNPVDLNDFFDGDGKIYGYQGLKKSRLCGFNPIKPDIDTAVQTLTKGKLSKKAQIPRFTPPLNAFEKVRETLKINKKQFLKCWEILIYLALDPIDKYTSVITNHVRTDILGKDLDTPKRQVVDVPSMFEPEASFVVFKSINGEETTNSNVQVDETKPDQEQQLKQLVEERISEIKLVSEKVYKICPKVKICIRIQLVRDFISSFC